MSGELLIEGGCHCRAVRYRLHWPEAQGVTQIPARRCGCSFCTRIDGVWTSHPEARLEISESAASPTRRYRFATGTADFLFCGQCGITPLVVCRLDDRDHAVVNINTFDPVEDPAWQFDEADTDFDGESVDDRLARRKARWIGRVEWVND